MKMFEVRAVEIAAPPERVFEFVRDPANLPRWARAFRSADESRARLETPAGAVDIALGTTSHRAARTVDWKMTFPDQSVAIAQCRTTETTRGTCIVSFVLHAPPVPLEQVEGALEAQVKTLREELETLRRLMES